MEKTDSMIINEVAASNGQFPRKSASSSQHGSNKRQRSTRRSKSPQFYQDSTGVIKRAYRQFSAPPTKQPLSVCFHCPHQALTHQKIFKLIRHRLDILEDPGGYTLQYFPRVVIHGASGLEDRWVAALQTEGARKELLRGLFDAHTQTGYVVRRYDDVLHEEYQKFLRLSSMTNEVLSLGF